LAAADRQTAEGISAARKIFTGVSTHDGMEANHSQQFVESVLNPCGEVDVDEQPIAGRLDDLAGATVGLLDNSKANADVLLDEVASVLTNEHGVAEIVSARKDKSPIPADSLADTLAAQCDAVVNAYGDCGSCTSWCVYDSIDLERRGVPVATVNSDEFVKLGQSEARSLGMPGLPIVTVPHPMGDIEESVVRERTRAIVDELADVLMTDAAELADTYQNRYLDADEDLTESDLYCPL
jgi:hypothetical protein